MSTLQQNLLARIIVMPINTLVKELAANAEYGQETESKEAQNYHREACNLIDTLGSFKFGAVAWASAKAKDFY